MNRTPPTNQQKREAYKQGITKEIELLWQQVDFHTKRIKILLNELEATV